MELGRTLYVWERARWRAWLEENHRSEKEIWLVHYTKASGRPNLDYQDAVEEALCYGWIDSIVKKLDTDGRAQRYSPRRPKSQLSELNKERIRRLMRDGMMAPAGLEAIRHHLVPDEAGTLSLPTFVIPDDILEEIRSEEVLWQQFQNLPEDYIHVRIGFIHDSRGRPEVFRQRLDYFKKMTRQGKRYGSYQGDPSRIIAKYIWGNQKL